MTFPSIFSRSHVRWWLAAVTVAWGLSPASAAITTVAYYHLGEDDAGAANGGTGNSVTIGRDASGISTPGLDLPRIATPTYSSSVSSSAALNTGSTLGMTFSGTDATGSGYTRSTALSTAVNNYGLEAWFKLNSTADNQVIVVNGNSGGSGYGLMTSGGTFQAIYGGQVFINSTKPIDTNWHHFAVVRNNGTTQLYFDGVAAGSTTGTAPNNPSSGVNPGFGIGRNYAPGGVGAGQLNGIVDEVRLFTFTAGAFSTSDLLINAIPEPGTYAAALSLASLALLGWRRKQAKAPTKA